MTSDQAPIRDPGGREGASGNARSRPEKGKPVPPIISPIKSTELQLGEHIVRALQGRHTVAVVTTVVASPDGAQSIISVPLTEPQLDLVQSMLLQAEQERIDRVPCVGFHCWIGPNADRQQKSKDTS